MDGRAQAMARRRQACGARPTVGRGVVGLDLREGAGRALATDDEDAPLQHGRGDAAARGRKRREPPPAVRGWVIGLVDIQVASVAAVDAAADGIETPSYSGDGEMIARGRNCSPRGPFVGGSIVDLVRADVA